MKILVIPVLAAWMTGGAYAADFNRQLSASAKDLEIAAAESVLTAAPAKRDSAPDASGAYELVCAPFGDSLADVLLNAASLQVTYLSGRSETYFFDSDRPFVLDTPVSVFLGKRQDSQQCLGAWDKAVLFGITGYGPGPDVSAELAMGGVVYPLKCHRRW